MKIAAFNIQKFGKRKLSDPAVAQTLIKVKTNASAVFGLFLYGEKNIYTISIICILFRLRLR